MNSCIFTRWEDHPSPEGNGALLVNLTKACYAVREVMNGMETKDLILRLRREKGL